MKLLSAFKGKSHLFLSAAGPLFLLYLFCIIRFHNRFELQVQTFTPLNIAVVLRSRDYLKNSVVIITGDHSFPVGEHGNYDSESGFYNEYFRTPLLIWGKGITPRVVREPHSQLDIAPTVLELTGISATVHFKGDSVFSAPPPFIPLIKPYAGGNLGVLSYPYKYVYNKRSQREYLFNIVADPSEKNNITETADSRPLYESLRRKAGEILLNDRLVKENRIWDRSRER